MSRSSTVVRVSATMLRALIAFCTTHHCGVILRIGGIETGWTAAELDTLLEMYNLNAFNAREDGRRLRPSRYFTRKGWDSRYAGFPARTHYVHDAYDCHEALDDVLAYARSIGGAELVEAVTSDPLYQLLDDDIPSGGRLVNTIDGWQWSND